MKKQIFLPIMFILLAGLATAATIRENPIPEGTSVRITIVNQEPDPVEPGSVVDVRFKIENLGSKRADNVTLEVMQEFPFSVYSGDAVKNVGGIYSRQIGDEGVILKYRIKVDKEAVAGESLLKLRYKTENGPWVELDKFYINIKPQDALILIKSIGTADQLSPGVVGTVDIKLKNMADFLIKNVKVKLNLNSQPFAPIGTTNEQILEFMDPQEETTVSFKLMAEPDAESNVYKIPLELKYLDGLGTSYHVNQTIGLIIGEKPDLLVTLESSTIPTKNKKGEIVIKFVNRGLSNIKFLNVQLKPSNDYVILSSDQFYIGNIDSDDYETSDFTIYAKRESERGKLFIPIKIEYRDANNNEYSKDYNLELKLYSSTEASKLGLDGGNNFLATAMTVVIVVLVLWLYKKKKFPFGAKKKK